MKIKRKWLYLVLIVAAVLVTPDLVFYAENIRGYVAVGGEWLLVPLAILIGCFIESFIELIRKHREIK